MAGNDNTLCGMLGVYKPKDWTSFDVVAKLRGILHTKKIGHGGTLDPMAEGVLPVFVGKAARACDIIPDRKKAYTAGFRLGLTTDTEDITGEILTQSSRGATLDQINSAREELVGDIMQVPPMYSAVKVGGKKLYELAREGKVIEREARPIHVESITVTSYDEQKREGVMEILCEKGTYVRTLISSVGEKLGTGAVMTSLVRTYSGGCSIKDCLTLEEIARRVKAQGAQSLLECVDKAFMSYGAVTLDDKALRLYSNGVKLRPDQVGIAADDRIYRVYSHEGFLGLGYFDKGLFRTKKNFV